TALDDAACDGRLARGRHSWLGLAQEKPAARGRCMVFPGGAIAGVWSVFAGALLRTSQLFACIRRAAGRRWTIGLGLATDSCAYTRIPRHLWHAACGRAGTVRKLNVGSRIKLAERKNLPVRAEHIQSILPTVPVLHCCAGIGTSRPSRCASFHRYRSTQCSTQATSRHRALAFPCLLLGQGGTTG